MGLFTKENVIAMVIAFMAIIFLAPDMPSKTNQFSKDDGLTKVVSDINNPYDFGSIEFDIDGELTFYHVRDKNGDTIRIGLLSDTGSGHLLNYLKLVNTDDSWEVHITDRLRDVLATHSPTTLETHQYYVSIILAAIILRYRSEIEGKEIKFL